jgi:N6-adenosine-specific RNA methylase IME4
LPSIKLDVDIMNFSLEQFAEKFNSFDMIHCSLPLDMLIKMPNISSLIPKGFIFIWVEKGEIQIGYHWLNRIGFDVIDQIMWIKTNEMVNEVKYDENTDDEIFPNCRSTCLVGYKCSASQRTEYCTKISNNIIFSPDRPASIEKPDEIYEIGDLMMPGAKKL